MKFINIKAIIWDLDGTLINSLVVMKNIIAELAPERGLVLPTEAEIDNNFHGSLDETLQGLFNIKSAEELAELVDYFLKKQIDHYKNLDEHLYQDAINLVKQAAHKNLLQLVLTNRSHANRGSASPRHIIGNTVLAKYIHEIRCGDEVKVRKPDVGAVEDWVNKHNLLPGEILVIGDQTLDAQLALNLKARAILVRRNGEIPHIKNLPSGWQESVFIVDHLDGISFN